jgi:hypothetical protein
VDPRLIAAFVAAFLAVIVAVMVIVWDFARNHPTANFGRRFGAENHQPWQQVGLPRAVWIQRVKGVEKFQIRKLTPDEREQFAARWRGVQWRFLDDRGGAVVEADLLVSRLMQLCGYPTAGFEQPIADISRGHARIVDRYRAAHRIAIRQVQGLATAEDLHHAIIYYRSLFAELLEGDVIDQEREVA